MSLNEKYAIIAILIGLLAAIMALLHRDESSEADSDNLGTESDGV